jgi:hypothetical protein
LQTNTTSFGVGARRQTPNHATIFFNILARLEVQSIDGSCGNGGRRGVFRSVETSAIHFHRGLQHVTENLPGAAFVARAFDIAIGNVVNADARNLYRFSL